MAASSSQGIVEGERPVAAESPRRHSSIYSLRSNSLSVEDRHDHQDCRSLSHLGILMPLYLLPLFFLGTKYGGSLYCLLLPLLLWAFNSLPKAGAALVHLVTLPLFGLMAPEEIARQYLSTDVLTVALVLFLVIVVDRWSELVLSLAYGVCARFGLQRKWLFFGTCLCSFAFAWLFSGPLVSVTLLYFLDRLMSTIYKGNMDRAPDGLPRSPRRGSVQESSSLRSLSEADQVLFDRLAKLAMSMKKPERRKWRNRHPLEENNESDAAAAPTASGTNAALKGKTRALRSSPPRTIIVQCPDFDWATGVIAEPPTGALSTHAYARGASPLLPDTGLVRVDIANQKETLNPAQPLSSAQPPSLPAMPLEEKGDKENAPLSAIDGSPGRKHKPDRQLTLNAKLGRNAPGHKNGLTTDADGVIPVSTSKRRPWLFRRFSNFASRLTRKRTRDAQFKHADEESGRSYNIGAASSTEPQRNGGAPQPNLGTEKAAPVRGWLTSYSDAGTALDTRQAVRPNPYDSAHSNAAPAQTESALVPTTQGTDVVTDSVIHPASAPVVSETHLALQQTLPSVIRDSDSSVSASLVPAAPGHQPWTKQAVEETTASCSVPGSRSNLPSQNFGSAKSDSENTTAKPVDKVSRQESAVAAEEKTGERLIHSIGQVASASALGDANKEGKMEFQGAHQDDSVSWSKLCQTEDRRTTSRNELPGSVSRKSMDKPFDNRPRNFESKGAQGEHPERLERVLPAAVDEEPCNTGSAASPSQNICQQEDTKAFERFRNKEDGQSHGAKSYTAAIIDTKPQQSITANEEPGLKDPERKTETCPRKGSNDSLGKPLLQNSYRKNIASAHWDGLEPVLDEKQDNCSCKTSGTDASLNEDRSNAKKASLNVTAEKKHRTHEASGHKVVPAKTEHKSGVRATEGPHSTHTDDHPEKRKEMQCRKSVKDSLKNQPHHHHTPRRKSKGSNGQQVEVLPAQQPRHPPRYISKGDRRDASSGGTRGSTDSGSEKTELAVKRQNSLPNKHVYDEHPPVQLEASRPETTADPVAQSMRGSTSERHHGNYADSQSDVSRRSKTAVKIHHGSDVPDAKEHPAGTVKAMTAEDGSEKRADKRLSREDASSKFTAEKPLQSAGPAASEETRRSQNSKLVSGAVPPKKQPQNFTSGTSAPKASALDGAEITSTMELKRKQSVVSFGADLFGAIQPQPEFSAPGLTEHSEEAATRPSQGRRLSAILKTSNFAMTAPRTRRRSSVEFGAAKFTVISPLQKHDGGPPARRHSMSSRISTGSLSSLGGDSEGRGSSRAPHTLRRMTRSRSYAFDDTVSRPSIVASQIGSQFPSVPKKKTNSARADVHNAFLLGSSLMTVLGNICSFHAGGNKAALGAVLHPAEIANQSVTDVTWAIVTLPGALLALLTCTVVIWISYIKPHEPEPQSSENLAVMRIAQEKIASPVKRRGVECAYATYLAIFSLSYVPSQMLGLEPRITLVVALAAMILVTSSLTSCLRAAFEFIRNIWQMLPWGVLLLLGATHVASEVVQVHTLVIEAFSMVPSSFWEERTLLEVQTLLAFAAAIMAEGADKQVIVEIMMPVVGHISEMKQMYPAYYAIPVVVGASSNVIMPSSVPTALLHDLSRVPFWKMLLLGLFSKTVVMSMVIVTVNVMDRVGLLGTDAPHD